MPVSQNLGEDTCARAFAPVCWLKLPASLAAFRQSATAHLRAVIPELAFGMQVLQSNRLGPPDRTPRNSKISHYVNRLYKPQIANDLDATPMYHNELRS